WSDGYRSAPPILRRSPPCFVGWVKRSDTHHDRRGSLVFPIILNVFYDSGGLYQLGLRFSRNAVVPSRPSGDCRCIQPSCASSSTSRSFSSISLEPSMENLVRA